MANSLRTKLKKLAHDGKINQQELDELLKKLDGHDRELQDKNDELEEENSRLGNTVDELNKHLTDAFEKIRKLQEDCNRYHEWGMHEGYEEGYAKGGSDMEKAKQIIIDKLQEQIPKWHYVVDNDFPTNDDNRFYLCISENHEEDLPTMFQFDSELGFGWWEDIYDEHTLGFVDSEFHTVEEEHLEKVITWTELPKFEREE